MRRETPGKILPRMDVAGWILAGREPSRLPAPRGRQSARSILYWAGRLLNHEGMTDPASAASSADPSADALLAAIVDSSFDAIIGKNLDSVITSWNAAAERLFGYTAAEAIGQPVLMLIPEHLRGEEAEIIARIRRGEQVASFETRRRRKNGNLVWVSLTISPVRNADGSIIGASKIARDITASKESERQIRLLMREVNHRVKNQFAVILSMIRETGKRSATPREFEERIRDRIMALARSHDLLVASEWSGASLRELAEESLNPFGHEDRIGFDGPALVVQPNAVQHIGLAFHELGTNSAKHGALAGDSGSVAIRWAIRRPIRGHPEFELTWDEAFTPSTTAQLEGEAPRKGFGTVVLQRVTPQSLNGSASFERTPGHVRWALTAPLETVIFGEGETAL
jgi:PAS domain S-box-containing protein